MYEAFFMARSFSTSSEVQEYYQQSSVSDAYEKIRFSTLLGRIVNEREAELVPKILSEHKVKFVIELACGTGRITRVLRDFSGIGVDASAEMMKFAQASVKGSAWSFVRSDVFAFESKKKADAVVSFRLFRHLDDLEQERFLVVARSVLKKNGILVLDVLNRDRGLAGRLLEGLFHAARTLKGFVSGSSGDRVFDSFHSRESITRFLQVHGFEVLAFHPVVSTYGRVFLVHWIQKLFPFSTPEGWVRAQINRDARNHSSSPLQWVVVARRSR